MSSHSTCFFRSRTVVLELFYFLFSLLWMLQLLLCTMPTMQNTTNSRQLRFCCSNQVKQIAILQWKLAIHKPHRHPALILGSHQQWHPLLPRRFKLLWLLNERTIRLPPLPSHRLAPWLSSSLANSPVSSTVPVVSVCSGDAPQRRTSSLYSSANSFWPLEEDCRLKVCQFILCL